MYRRHRIQFPKQDSTKLDQDEAYFYLQTPDGNQKIRFHDYDELYKVPGLYDQLYYDRLKCSSPTKVSAILEAAVKQSNDAFTELRILELGAGNGIVGEELKKRGACRLVGVDIIPEAYEAVIRDRPGIYDAYFTQDFTALEDATQQEISSWGLTCMVCVAALGFGDIPSKAFIEAFNMISTEGWVAFNIKETFLDRADETGFSRLIRELIFSKYLDVYHIERYRHRLSIDGEPLFYFAIAGRKHADVSDDFLQSLGLDFG